MVVGHPRITEKAYQDSTVELRTKARDFAEATVHNGLGPHHSLDRTKLSQLKAQIERDVLVLILAYTRSN